MNIKLKEFIKTWEKKSQRLAIIMAKNKSGKTISVQKNSSNFDIVIGINKNYTNETKLKFNLPKYISEIKYDLKELEEILDIEMARKKPKLLMKSQKKVATIAKRHELRVKKALTIEQLNNSIESLSTTYAVWDKLYDNYVETYKALIRVIDKRVLFKKNPYGTTKAGQRIYPVFKNREISSFSTYERQYISICFALLFSSPKSTIIFDDISEGSDTINLANLAEMIKYYTGKNGLRAIMLTSNQTMHHYFGASKKYVYKLDRENNIVPISNATLSGNSLYNSKDLKNIAGWVYWVSFYLEANKSIIEQKYKCIFDTLFLHASTRDITNSDVNNLLKILPKRFQTSVYDQLASKKTLEQKSIYFFNEIESFHYRINNNNAAHLILLLRTRWELIFWKICKSYGGRFILQHEAAKSTIERQDAAVDATHNEGIYSSFFMSIANMASHNLVNNTVFLADVFQEEYELIIEEELVAINSMKEYYE